MSPVHLFLVFLVALVMLQQVTQPTSAQTPGPKEQALYREPRPFADKPVAIGHIHTEPEANFQAWRGGYVPIGNYDPKYFERNRIGTINVSPSLRVHLDTIADKVDFPSYFELLDTKSGRLLGRYPVFNLDDAVWYFAGNGIAYLNQAHLNLCGSRYTRKLVVSGGALAEVRQPLTYIGEETNVLETTPLYDSPTGKAIVATVPPNSKVQVIGLTSELPDDRNPPLLIRTPFGLTGWHRHQGNIGEGRLEIYLCN